MKSRGFTLIELAVVLAIISVLAAVLTPIVVGYLDQARLARAQADVRTIADAIKMYRNDTGVYPFFDTSTAAGLGTKTNVAGGKDVVATANGNWVVTVAFTSPNVTANTMESYLNGNIMNRSTTATGGRVVFRGPYVGTIEADPWGNRYYVNAGELGSDALNWAFVVSAGPNGTIETSTSQPKTGAFTVSPDDLA